MNEGYGMEGSKWKDEKKNDLMFHKHGNFFVLKWSWVELCEFLFFYHEYVMRQKIYDLTCDRILMMFVCRVAVGVCL